MSKKAKEILKNQANNGDELLEDEDVNVYEVLVAMKIYAKQKCKEQRELCYKKIAEFPDVEYEDLKIIKNATEPELE